MGTYRIGYNRLIVILCLLLLKQLQKRQISSTKPLLHECEKQGLGKRKPRGKKISLLPDVKSHYFGDCHAPCSSEVRARG